MAGSRGFLLVLLVATVTCIVLVQVSLDGWIRRGSHHFYQLAVITTKEEIQDRNLSNSHIELLKTSPLEPSLPRATQHKFPGAGQRRLANRVSLANVSIWTKSVTAVPSQRVEAKVRVRNLHKASPVNLLSPPKQSSFIEHQAQFQELLKHKDLLRKRDPIKSVNAMPTMNPSDVNRIFLITYFRSGSSFLGELLQQNWKTFYQFEPLHYMTYGSRISGANKTEEALDLFNSIYHCNFSNLDNYFQWVRKPKNQFLFTRSLFLWFTCRTNPRMCFYPDFVSAVCKRAPVQVIKTTRLHMQQLRIFLDENPDLNIKVVFLTRDPRGIISSRWTLLDWCNGTDCSDPNVICSEMRDDIRIFEELRSKEPSKFIRVRYEDLALSPEMESKKLLQFLNLTYSQSVSRFLKSHTTARKTDNLDPYSTRRNSSSMAFSWKRRFNFEQVQTIQNSCTDIINHLNYSVITSPNELDITTSKIADASSLNSLKKTKHFVSSGDPVIGNHLQHVSVTVGLNNLVVVNHEKHDTFISKDNHNSYTKFSERENGVGSVKHMNPTPNSNNFYSNSVHNFQDNGR